MKRLVSMLLAASLGLSAAFAAPSGVSCSLRLDPGEGMLFRQTLTGYAGDRVSLPTPSRSGHTFICWSDGEAGYTGSIPLEGSGSLSAVWGGTVTLDENGGELHGEDPGGVYPSGTIITLPAAVRSGKSFAGWTDGYGGTFGPGDYTVSGDAELVAVWKESGSGVSVLLGPGDAVAEGVIDTRPGNTILLPEAERSGASFLYWTDGTNGYAVGSQYKVPGSGFLTAVWEASAIMNDEGLGSTEMLAGPLPEPRQETPSESQPETPNEPQPETAPEPEAPIEPTVPVRLTDASGGFTVSAGDNGTVTLRLWDSEGREVSSVPDAVAVEVPGTGSVVAETDPSGNEILALAEKSYVRDGVGRALVKDAGAWKVVGNTLSFNDVDSGSWYAEAVDFVSSHRLFNGVTEHSFEPDGQMTRSMLVTTLWRLEGRERPRRTGSFADVPENSWYADAVRWAAEQKIVGGYENGSFQPNKSISREEMCAILYRYARYLNRDVSKAAALDGFRDAGSVSPWAVPSMRWAFASGFITGRSTEAIAPQDTASRAEVATMLMRMVRDLVESS